VISHTVLTVVTKGKGLCSFAQQVSDWLHKQPVRNGALLLFIQHTSCSLIIQENADPDVTLDLRDFFERLVPEDDEQYRHTSEGPNDMTSHIRASLTNTSLTIPVIGGEMALGKWQGIYLFEHRVTPHQRRVVAQIMGE
jgi:secondary thiamine-phosphate synthase enzyme